MKNDDDPRSPKRRRISVDDGQKEVKPTSLAQVAPSEAQSVPATQPRSLEGQTQDGQTDPQNADPSPDAPKVPPDGHAQEMAKIAVVAQNAVAATQQANPLEQLPALDLQASQILTFLSRLTPSDAMGLSTRPNAPSSREYAALRAAFDRTRRLISPGWPFLPQHDLGLHENNQIEIIRKANQAIFMSSIFTGEIGLRDMDRSFLAVFVPENGELSKAQGSMYLELKTQGFITAWRTGAAPPNLVMSDMFGLDLDKAILTRRPGTTLLTPIEQEFLRLLSARRGVLESAVNTKTLDQLPVTYKWEDFSREVSSYLITHIEKTSKDGAPIDHGQLEAEFLFSGPSLPTSSMGSEPPVKEDFVALAAKAADHALRSVLGLSPSDPIPAMPSSRTSTPIPNPIVADSAGPQSGAPGGTALGPAKNVAQPVSENSSPSARRLSWSEEEKEALMTGLEKVKGTHWTQILAMYGAGGSVSEALKDRNQDQLNEKVYNLKLFFQKSGAEVPYYLRDIPTKVETPAQGPELTAETGDAAVKGPESETTASIKMPQEKGPGVAGTKHSSPLTASSGEATPSTEA